MNCPEHGDYPVGKDYRNNTRWDRAAPSLGPGLAIPAQAIPAYAQKKRNPAKYEPQRQLLGQRIHGIFFGLLKSALLYLQEFKSVKHFEQERIANLDYYNNRRIKAKRKGLLPAIHRQQALSVA
ncbi:IS3 family transposase [Anaeromassilibacillus sp. Marseille-P3371]|uniref:IS3 family transposase n=1 Tax=Anaeromassilibacillus sp. Marseille-P3371 TaxID=1944639 RepID=UPI000A1C9BA5